MRSYRFLLITDILILSSISKSFQILRYPKLNRLPQTHWQTLTAKLVPHQTARLHNLMSIPTQTFALLPTRKRLYMEYTHQNRRICWLLAMQYINPLSLDLHSHAKNIMALRTTIVTLSPALLVTLAYIKFVIS